MVWIALALVGLALAAYALIVAGVYLRLFVPPRVKPGDEFAFTPWEFQADYEDVDLVTADGVNFGAWFFRQPGSAQVVIVSGGHHGRRAAVLGVCMALWRKGFNVVTYSYRGYQDADRRPVTMGVHEVQELQAAIAFARKRVRGARVGLLGYSMGASVSLLGAAGEPGIEALVLDSPYADIGRLLGENLRRVLHLPASPFLVPAATWLRLRTGARLWDASPIRVISALEPRPLFFIHGGADPVTNQQHSRDLYDAYRGPREIWIVQGAPHTGAYFADRELYVERVASFFARHLGLAKPSGTLRLLEDEDEAAG